MKKLSYEWNPSKNLANHTYASLSQAERSHYRDLLDYIWLSNDQFRVELNHETLKEVLGIELECLEQLLAKLIGGHNPLLVEEFCLDGCLFYLQSPELHKQLIQFRKLDESIIESAPTSRISNRSLVLKISNAESGTKLKEYVGESKVGYQNWLPTHRYDTAGQKFIISKELKAYLDSISPTCNVEAELGKMFNWLNRYPEKRRAYADMKIFVCTWIRNADSRGSNSDIDFDALDNEIEKLLSNMAASA